VSRLRLAVVFCILQEMRHAAAHRAYRERTERPRWWMMRPRWRGTRWAVGTAASASAALNYFVRLAALRGHPKGLALTGPSTTARSIGWGCKAGAIGAVKARGVDRTRIPRRPAIPAKHISARNTDGESVHISRKFKPLVLGGVHGAGNRPHCQVHGQRAVQIPGLRSPSTIAATLRSLKLDIVQSLHVVEPLRTLRGAFDRRTRICFMIFQSARNREVAFLAQSGISKLEAESGYPYATQLRAGPSRPLLPKASHRCRSDPGAASENAVSGSASRRR